MSLYHQFKQAEKILFALDDKDKKKIINICQEIRSAEIELQKKSGKFMRRCLERCNGMCCRNVQLDLIINQFDFLYIMTIRPDLKPKILECLKKEKPFFPMDCVFLKNGKGPCIFPSDARPEVCLVTFCDDTGPVRKEIGKVKRKFFKLTWSVFLMRVKHFLNVSKT
jgi:hypothetical protein